jgi:dihydroflavonol-4-reductase
VLTSSLSSVAYGREVAPDHVFSESDWSDPDAKGFGMGPYQRAKTLAELAAWDFVRKLPSESQFELVAVCPGSIFGPLLGAQVSLLTWPRWMG